MLAYLTCTIAGRTKLDGEHRRLLHIVEAAHEFGRSLPGKLLRLQVCHRKVMVIGAGGVAGLAAIGATNSSGAIVRAFDTRPEVKEQVQSMGAEFLELDFKDSAGSGDGCAKVTGRVHQSELLAAQAKEVDIIVTTALIPGKPAPKPITREKWLTMKRRRVTVDPAAQKRRQLRNTPCWRNFHYGKWCQSDWLYRSSSRLLTQSSHGWYKPVNLLKLLCKEKDGNIIVDFDDVVRFAA